MKTQQIERTLRRLIRQYGERDVRRAIEAVRDYLVRAEPYYEFVDSQTIEYLAICNDMEKAKVVGSMFQRLNQSAQSWKLTFNVDAQNNSKIQTIRLAMLAHFHLTTAIIVRLPKQPKFSKMIVQLEKDRSKFNSPTVIEKWLNDNQNAQCEDGFPWTFYRTLVGKVKKSTFMKIFPSILNCLGQSGLEATTGARAATATARFDEVANKLIGKKKKSKSKKRHVEVTLQEKLEELKEQGNWEDAQELVKEELRKQGREEKVVPTKEDARKAGLRVR
jgi:hypothetical protein